jgi:protein involved in polysaccharide export with SLBB domain
MKLHWSLIALILFFTIPLYSQIDPSVVEAQIAELGLDEDEVIARLADKGIDINTIGPEDVNEVQTALEEVIAEMTAEQAEANAGAPDQADTPGDNPGAPQPATNGAGTIPSENPAAGGPPPAVSATTPAATTSDTLPGIDGETPMLELPKSDIYGQQVFREQGNNVQLDPLNVKAPPSYVLGPGDEVAVSVFGASQASFNFIISPQGYIQPPGMSRIYLKGITLGQARTLMANRFRQYYNFGPGEFEVAISYSRVIQVNIVGEVFNPGSYTIPAANTIFNALVTAGGPNDIGSVRRIQLMRDGEAPRVFDVVEFMTNPNLETEFYLQANDYIFVPVYEKVVQIEGAIRRPYRYELLEGENLRALIDLAGGFDDNAYLANAQITRIEPDGEKIIDINLGEILEQGSDFDLQGGDRINIRPIEKAFENFVDIGGTVRYPGKYQYTNGMRVSDLIALGVLERNTRRDIAYLFRTRDNETVEMLQIDLAAVLADPNSAANIPLSARDNVRIFSQVTFIDKATLSTTGAVREPTEINYDPTENVRISDMILLSGGLLPNTAEFAYIKRTDLSNKTEIDYIRINVYNVVRDTSALDNVQLKPNDQVIFYTNEQFVDEANIVISGAVRTPGEFQYDDGIRVTDLIYFADGLKPEAADIAYINRTNQQTKEVEYIRVDLAEITSNPASPANLPLQPFDQITILNRTTFIDETTVSVSGSVRNPGTYQFDETLTLRDALTLAGGLKLGAASNRVEVSRVVIRNNEPTQTVVAIVEVDENLQPVNGGSGGDFQLQPYDEIIVRNVPEFKLQQNIVIEGEINYPGAHPLLADNERLSSLIERAGGLTNEAFPEGATLLRAEEGVGFIIMDLPSALKKKGSRFDYILKPGDIITIPTQLDFVTVQGETKANELYNDQIIQNGKVVVPYHKGRRAKYYVRKYAAGVSEDGRSSLITVAHPNGEVKKTINLGIIMIHPKVRKGSVVTVGKKPVEEEVVAEGEQKEKIDWGQVVADSIAQATAILSLILLIQNVN